MESILKFGQCGAIALLCLLQCPWTVSQFQSLHFANNDQNIKHVRNLAKASELGYQYTDGTYLQSGETPPDNIEADAYVQLPKDDGAYFVKGAASGKVESFDDPSQEQIETLRSLGYLEGTKISAALTAVG